MGSLSASVGSRRAEDCAHVPDDECLYPRARLGLFSGRRGSTAAALRTARPEPGTCSTRGKPDGPQGRGTRKRPPHPSPAHLLSHSGPGPGEPGTGGAGDHLRPRTAWGVDALAKKRVGWGWVLYAPRMRGKEAVCTHGLLSVWPELSSPGPPLLSSAASGASGLTGLGPAWRLSPEAAHGSSALLLTSVPC